MLYVYKRVIYKMFITGFQHDAEYAAIAGFAFHCNFTMMQIDNLLT